MPKFGSSYQLLNKNDLQLMFQFSSVLKMEHFHGTLGVCYVSYLTVKIRLSEYIPNAAENDVEM